MNSLKFILKIYDDEMVGLNFWMIVWSNKMENTQLDTSVGDNTNPAGHIRKNVLWLLSVWDTPRH